MKYIDTIQRNVTWASLLAVCALLGEARGDAINRITLRETASAGEPIRLGDVATVEGPDAAPLSEQVVGEFGGLDRMVLTADVLSRALADRGTNMARVSIRGRLQVAVSRSADADSRSSKVVSRSVERSQTSEEGGEGEGAVKTVQTLIAQWLEKQLGRPADQIRLTFEDPRQPALAWTNLVHRYEFRARSTQPVGRRLLIEVRRYLGEKAVERPESVRVSVAVLQPVVKATRSLDRGQIVTREDVKLDEQWMETLDESLLKDLEGVVGQRMDRPVRAESALSSEDLTAPLLVRRGQLVKATCISGTVRLEKAVRALEGNSLGQWVKVRDEMTGREFMGQVVRPGEVKITLRPSGAVTYLDKSNEKLKKRSAR